MIELANYTINIYILNVLLKYSLNNFILAIIKYLSNKDLIILEPIIFYSVVDTFFCQYSSNK